MIDATLYPETATYLSRLPDGLGSHRECEVKGSVVREVAAGFDAATIATLPPVLREVIANPPPVSSWVHEVPLNVLLLVQHETLVRRTGQRDAMFDRAFDATRALLNTPLYKILFIVVSPERLFSGLDRRWNAMRRGTSIELLELAPMRARIRAHFPTQHYNETLVKIRAASLRASLSCAGAKDVEVTIDAVTKDRCDWSARWR